MTASMPLDASEQGLLEHSRELVLRGNLDGALHALSEAAVRYPASGDIRIGLAGLHWQMRQYAQAKTLLRDWLAGHPEHAAASFLLAQCLREQGHMPAAAQVVDEWFKHGQHDADTVIRAAEMLDDYGRQRNASAICEAAIAAGSVDPRVHAYAGMLSIQLGEFARARTRYDFTLEHSAEAVEWNIPIGLAGLQRYQNSHHPDFALFNAVLNRPGLGDVARSTTLFALGKAHDDIADYAKAAQYLRQANTLAHTVSSWSRKRWKRSVEARLAHKPYPFSLAQSDDWTPIFIVGVPRSGTTLLAELIGRQPSVCNRGELGWLQVLAQRLSVESTRQLDSFEEAAACYAAQLRQDDLESKWFIDKQPLNLLYIDLIMALWPHARIIYCQRDARDTALSLWSQSFRDRAHDYAYDFDNIAAVIQGCRRLMAHWHKRYPASIRTVHYEELVATPDGIVAQLSDWLKLTKLDGISRVMESQGISTASAWQVRQPIYTRSTGRWRNYADYLPELLRIPEL